MPNRRYSKQTINGILKDYQFGLTYKDIQSKYCVSEGGLIRVLKRHNVIGRGKSDISRERCGRKWFWDFLFFTHNNPLTAYWSGFILADGSLVSTKDGWHLKIEIQAKDLSHLYKFCDAISLNKNAVKTRVRKPHVGALVQSVSTTCFVCLVHQNLFKSLARWGISPDKSHYFTKIDAMNNKMASAFLRGWFDGDGNLYCNKRHQEKFIITGNSESLLIYEKMLRIIGYDGTVKYLIKKDQCWGKLRVSGRKQILKIIDLLHLDEGPFLQRKWEKISNCIAFAI
jgi:hypothetical protein